MATMDEIRRFRPGYAQAVDVALKRNKAHQHAVTEALENSQYRYWYWASLGAFVSSLLFPKAKGLYMLALGWIVLQYSLAWIANPLLILAYVLARPRSDPMSWRLAYWALAMMFTVPVGSFTKVSLFPFFPWVVSPVLLIIGIERYRFKYRQALAKSYEHDDVGRQ